MQRPDPAVKRQNLINASTEAMRLREFVDDPVICRFFEAEDERLAAILRDRSIPFDQLRDAVADLRALHHLKSNMASRIHSGKRADAELQRNT